MPRSRMACYMSLVLGGAFMSPKYRILGSRIHFFSALNAITIFGKGYIRTQV